MTDKEEARLAICTIADAIRDDAEEVLMFAFRRAIKDAVDEAVKVAVQQERRKCAMLVPPDRPDLAYAIRNREEITG